jgi:hypothetical protein
LKAIEKEYEEDGIVIRMRQNEFYASQHLKNKIEFRVNSLLTSLTSITFESIPLYYDIADKEISRLKNIIQNNHCDCELKLRTNSKSYVIPKAMKTPSTTYLISKSVIEQSDLFCSSPLVYPRAKVSNGSIEVLIGDITVQKVSCKRLYCSVRLSLLSYQYLCSRLMYLLFHPYHTD